MWAEFNCYLQARSLNFGFFPFFFLFFFIIIAGTIQMCELEHVMRKLGMEYSEEALAETVKVVDTNGDNEIDFEEFLVLMNLTCMHKDGEKDPDWELRQAFATFDVDGSGYIDVTELNELMQKLGQNLTDAELQETMTVVDENGDGQVSFAEFKSIMGH